MRGTIVPNDRGIRHVKGVRCLYAPHLVRYTTDHDDLHNLLYCGMNMNLNF